MAKRKGPVAHPSPLEDAVMQVVWEHGQVSAEEVRQALAETHKLKDSTVRTLLRRLEAKGMLEHQVEGRTYIYHTPIEPQHIAVDAVRNIVDRFCSGSVSSLLLGMANDRLVSADELRKLADQIEKAKAVKRGKDTRVTTRTKKRK